VNNSRDGTRRHRVALAGDDSAKANRITEGTEGRDVPDVWGVLSNHSNGWAYFGSEFILKRAQERFERWVMIGYRTKALVAARDERSMRRLNGFIERDVGDRTYRRPTVRGRLDHCGALATFILFAAVDSRRAFLRVMYALAAFLFSPAGLLALVAIIRQSTRVTMAFIAKMAIRISLLILSVHPARTFGPERAEAEAGTMLVACRLAGLSALRGHYADVNAPTQMLTS
jgi:hypothetical protein